MDLRALVSVRDSQGIGRSTLNCNVCFHLKRKYYQMLPLKHIRIHSGAVQLIWTLPRIKICKIKTVCMTCKQSY